MYFLRKTSILILVFVLLTTFVCILSYQTWKQNLASCACKKEGMTSITQDSNTVLNNITIMVNVLHSMTNELNKLRDWLVVNNDTLDRKTVQFAMVNLSGNLNNMSSDLSKLSSVASTYSEIIQNIIYRQMVSKVANDLGNQSTVVQNAANDLMIWSQWVEQNNRLNEIPGKMSKMETSLSQLAIYLTTLANRLNTITQTQPEI